LQLRIAAGERLTIRQEDVSWRGAAVECRIYAEDPNNDFLPSPGKMQHVERPSGPGIRLDTGIYPGWEVPMDYDPLLAKLAVWAETREDAIQRMRRALAEYYVSGIRTNISFFRQILDDAEFRAGHLHTGFIEEFFARASEPAEKLDKEYEAVAALAAAVFSADQKKTANVGSAASAVSRWVIEGRERMLR
jgi:acetyl-CoA carboxylase, biotin carboxylase subunit